MTLIIAVSVCVSESCSITSSLVLVRPRMNFHKVQTRQKPPAEDTAKLSSRQNRNVIFMRLQEVTRTRVMDVVIHTTLLCPLMLPQNANVMNLTGYCFKTTFPEPGIESLSAPASDAKHTNSGKRNQR